MFDYDVIIIGGGPAGSTVGCLLKKYQPALNVLIIERELFPRDHIGESQLPAISTILNEMGCWHKVEAANFPIKIGATYRWGESDKLWDFNFVPPELFKEVERPGQFLNQRKQTAFQVDRAVYDKILLEHAMALGCEVWQETKVASVEYQGDKVDAINLASGQTLAARYYVDASGNAAVLRRALAIKTSVPTQLKNIAVWDYWQNAEWAETIGNGGTRVQVMSISTGWLWFIPLSPTRTSIGYICPAAFYKTQSKKPDELYQWALSQCPRISELSDNATRENKLNTTKDWSFLSDRLAGENWFLAGEAAGFADPILAGGMTLAHSGARELAYTIIALDAKAHDSQWLKRQYEQTQKNRISQHIRFADYWYSANGQFSDLQSFTASIAADAGLDLAPEVAFQWLSLGGFTHDQPGEIAYAGFFNLTSLKILTRRFVNDDEYDEFEDWQLNQYTHFKLALEDATVEMIPFYIDGKIEQYEQLVRQGRRLPLMSFNRILVDYFKYIKEPYCSVEQLHQAIIKLFEYRKIPKIKWQRLLSCIVECLEVMVMEGWLIGERREGFPIIGAGRGIKNDNFITWHTKDFGREK